MRYKFSFLATAVAMLATSIVSHASEFTYQQLVTCLMKDNVCITYKPIQGPIIDNGARPWFYPEHSKNYGDVSVGSGKVEKFLLTNIGTGPLTVYGFDKGSLTDADMANKLSGVVYNPMAFRFGVSDCPLNSSFILGVSATCTLSVRYVPSAIQKEGDVLKLLHSSAEVGAVVQDILGEGVPPFKIPPNATTPTTGGIIDSNKPANPDVTPEETKKAISFSSDVLDFGEVDKNAVVAPLSVVVYNLLDKDLTFYSKSVLKQLYKFTDNCGDTLAAKSSCTIQVTLDSSKITKPSSADNLELRFKEGVIGSVSLKGLVKGLDIQSSPSPASVQGVGLNVDNAGNVVLSNTGTLTATLSNFTISDTPEGVAPIQTDTNSATTPTSGLGGFSSTPLSSNSNSLDASASNGSKGNAALVGFSESNRELLKIVDNKCVKLVPNASCTLTLNIRSAQEVDTLKYLNFDIDGKRYSLAIKTKVKEADLTVEPVLSDWGIVPFYSNQEKTITVTNISSKEVAYIYPQLPPFFKVASKTCTDTLAPGASCQYSISYTPDESSISNTTKNAALHNNGDVVNVPFKLKGAGKGPVLISNATLVNFGKVNPQLGYATQKIVLQNIGNEPANVSQLALDNDSFIVSGHTCQSAIAPKATCEITLQLNSSTNGVVTNNLVISSDSLKEPNLKIAIKGEINGALLTASPETIEFTDVAYGSAPEETSVITNQGNMPLTISAVVPYGYYMGVATTCKVGMVLKPQDTCTATFKMNTTAGVKDGASGFISIGSDAAKATISVKAKGTAKGSYMVVPEEVKAPLTKVGNSSYVQARLYNSAYQSFTLTGASLDPTATNAGQWSDLAHNCVDVKYQQVCDIKVKFTPDSHGPKVGRILFSSTDDRYPTGSIQLKGDGINGDIAFYVDGNLATEFDFNRLGFNEFVSKTIRMANVGVQSALVKGISINNSAWKSTGCVGQTLAPNTYCDFEISARIPFIQGVQTTKTAAFSFTFDTALKTAFTAKYISYGSWPLPLATSYTFANVTPYKVSKTQSIRIENRGIDTLSITNAIIDNDPYKEVSVDYSACKNVANTIGFCNIIINYTSLKEGPLAAIVRLQTNSLTQLYSTEPGELKLTIFGTSGAAIPKASFDNSPAEPTRTRQIYLANKGSSGMTIQSISVENISGTVQLTNPSECQAISAGSYCTLTTTVSGNAIQSNLKLNITGAAGDDGKGNVTLPLQINPEVTTLLSNDYLDPVGFYLTSSVWYNDLATGKKSALADGNLNTYVETRKVPYVSGLSPDHGISLDAPEQQGTSKINMLVENLQGYEVSIDLGYSVGTWYDGTEVMAKAPVAIPPYFKGYISIPINLYFGKGALSSWYIVGYRTLCTNCLYKYAYEPVRIYEARVIK